MLTRINGIQLKAVSCVLPSERLEIQSLKSEFGEQQIARIMKNSGIDELRIANDSIRTSDLCAQAAKNLIASENISIKDIDGVVFVSQTPDYVLPATSCILQDRLGLRKDILTIDVNSGCNGYVQGLFQSSVMLNSGGCKQILLLTGDTITKLLNPRDQSLRTIMGDCGSASLIVKDVETKDIVFSFFNDGSRFHSLIVPSTKRGSKQDLLNTAIGSAYKEDGDYLFMDGLEIMKFVLTDVVQLVKSTLRENPGVKTYVFHQANRFIVEALMKNLKLSKQNVPLAVKNYGNTGPASIPLALCDSFSCSGDKQREPGKSLLVGFGVGLSAGTAVLDLSETHFYSPVDYGGKS